MTKIKSKGIGQQGHCSQCGSENIDYQDSEHYDGQIKYEYVCSDCDYEGEEWYHEVFVENI